MGGGAEGAASFRETEMGAIGLESSSRRRQAKK
jgi:hypothetical protein